MMKTEFLNFSQDRYAKCFMQMHWIPLLWKFTHLHLRKIAFMSVFFEKIKPF